jgi:transcriptional regulator with XRE-family HTH domain
MANGELREFLRSRRARLSPADVNLPVRDGRRRVRGLRREELALLAGVSVDYYTRLEQGRAANVSAQVLAAVADALDLDPLERRHLFDLVKAVARRTKDAGAAPRPRARIALRMMLDALDPVPAVLHGPCMEVVAINRMAGVLLDDFDAMPAADRNMVRWVFLNPRARQVYPDWAEIAENLVAILRVTAGKGMQGPYLTELVEDLSARSPEFAAYWASYNVYQHTHGTKRIHHPQVGILTLNYESLIPPTDPDLWLIIYSPPTGSPSEDKLRSLAEWAGTRDAAAP